MLAKKNKNRSPHKYLAMKKFLLLPVFLFFFFGCSHHQDFEQQKSTISVDWNSYNWLIDASTYCVVKYLKDSNFSLESKTLIDNFYSQLFQEHCFSYPIPKSVSDEEKSIYEKICNYISLYSFCSEDLVDSLNNIPHSSDFLNLTMNAKTRVVLFFKTIIGVSNGFCLLLDEENSKEQKPREAYASSEGESRFERQLINCLSYQIDGHLETIAGTILYISSMPQSFFGDLITCGNEIYDGMWNHVN